MNIMLNRLLIVSTLALVAAQVAVAADRDEDAARTEKAAQVFKEIMDTPDNGLQTKSLRLVPRMTAPLCFVTDNSSSAAPVPTAAHAVVRGLYFLLSPSTSMDEAV
jgi:hypothetical protein